MQVSRLVSKMKEESAGDTEGAMRKQLLEKITALTQSRLPHVTGVLAMIWNGVVGPLDLPAPEPEPILKATIFLNWHRVKLALLKSILTGTFIDVQLFAYKTLSNGLPVDPRPLYTSSIVIERWGAAITTGKAILLRIHPILTHDQRNRGDRLSARVPVGWSYRRLRILAHGPSGNTP